MSEQAPETTDVIAGNTRGALSSEIRFSDLQAIRRALADGYMVGAEECSKCVRICDEIMSDPKANRRTRLVAIRVMGLLRNDTVRDLQHRERIEYDRSKFEAEMGIVRVKMDRAEQGLPNDSVAVILPAVNQLPLPKHLADRAAKLERKT